MQCKIGVKRRVKLWRKIMRVTEKLLARIRNLEAENTRLNEEADWLAEQLLCCTDDNRVDTCGYECRHLCLNTTIQEWREAARKAAGAS